MDVFGPVADNANGIGEMGYDKAEMGEKKYKEARQILADLDSVGTPPGGNQGIAIGSAVIAAVSLFASFIAVMAMGSEEKISEMIPPSIHNVAACSRWPTPCCLSGCSWWRGAVSVQLDDDPRGRSRGISDRQGMPPPVPRQRKSGLVRRADYARVVGICTTAAQKELIGPGLLAIMAPLAVGFLLGPLALAGFSRRHDSRRSVVGGVYGQCRRCVDNAKKLIEDEPRDLARNTGKGSERHKAAVTGDTVGDPLKDTAGPAINPLIKVMNMVSLLLLPIVLKFHAVEGVANSGNLHMPLPLLLPSWPLRRSFGPSTSRRRTRRKWRRWKGIRDGLVWHRIVVCTGA